MPNDSSTGGYLVPSSTPPPGDAALDAILQQYFVGLTGLPGNMVRPRWQPTVPKQPEPSANWCAIGITAITQDAFPALVHVAAGDGSDTMYRHERIEVLASFHGLNGQQIASQARDGMYVPQNNDMLRANLMAFVEADTLRAVPELVNQQWVKRYDFAATFRRQVVRTYPILNILSAQIDLTEDTTPPINEAAIVS